MKWMPALLVLAIPLAYASDKGSSKFTAITEQNLYDMVMRMSDKAVGDVLVQKQPMLGGNCKVVENSHGLALFTLDVPGSQTKRFGIKKPSGFAVTFNSTKAGFMSFKIPHLEAKYASRSEDERIIALKEMGAAFKAEISDRKWPCGSPTVQSRRLSLSDLKSETKFYKDELTGEVVCVAPNGKDSTVRKPDSCEYEPVLAELPAKLCKYLLHLARSEAEDELAMGTRKRSAGKKLRMTAKLPTFQVLSKDIRTKLELARFLRKEPDTFSYIDHAHVPVADSYINQDTLAFLEKGDSTSKDFSTLPPSMQLELTRVAVSMESIRSDSNFVAPSREMLELVDAIKPHADALIKANPGMQLDLYTFPRRQDVQETLNRKVASLSKIYGQEYNFQLNCDRRPKVFFKPKIFTELLKVKAPPTANYKLDSLQFKAFKAGF